MLCLAQVLKAMLTFCRGVARGVEWVQLDCLKICQVGHVSGWFHCCDTQMFCRLLFLLDQWCDQGISAGWKHTLLGWEWLWLLSFSRDLLVNVCHAPSGLCQIQGHHPWVIGHLQVQTGSLTSVYGSAPGCSIFQMAFCWNNSDQRVWQMWWGVVISLCVVSTRNNYWHPVCWTPWLQRTGLASHRPWGSGWSILLGPGTSDCQWRTFSFRGLRSTQMCIAPSFFGTTTMPAHQGVGLSTLEMTKCFHLIVHFGSWG